MRISVSEIDRRFGEFCGQSWGDLCTEFLSPRQEGKFCTREVRELISNCERDTFWGHLKQETA